MSNLADSPIYPASAGINAGAYDARVLTAPGDGWLPGVPAYGTAANNAPIDVLPQAATDGHLAASFAADWYNRIHLTPTLLELGNLASLQERSIEIWNGYLAPRTLQNVVETGGEGIDVLGLPTLPDVWAPLEANTYTVRVSLDGPPVIDASLAFVFDSGTSSLSITGTRIVAWSWSPNWARPVIERLSWLTDVITAYDGTEQRRRLRSKPRHSWEFEVLSTEDMRRMLDTSIWGWQPRVWALPIWPEVQAITSPVSAGDTSIACDTSIARLVPGQLAMLRASETHYELAEIASIGAGQILLKRPLTFDWPAGTRLYPVRTARLRDTQPLTRITSEVTRAVMQFDGAEPEPGIEAITEPTYRDEAVLTRQPNWSAPLSDTLLRDLEVLDNLTGSPVVANPSGRARRLQGMQWLVGSRQDVLQLRRELAARAGRWSPIWVPTWTQDIRITGPITAASQGVAIRNMGYARMSNTDIGRRDIRLALRDGTVLYRRIIGATEVDETTENVFVDTPWGVDASPADVQQVSFMSLSRLGADAVEIAHLTDGVARMSVQMRTTHDV